MRNYFTFGSYDSRNLGIYLSGSGVFNSPEQSLEFISIPGRNGDLIGSNKKFENVELVYPAFVSKNMLNNIVDIKSALMSVSSYARLSDTYFPSEYRMAVCTDAIVFNPLKDLKAAEMDIVFNCKPQRYLTIGETKQTFTASGTISNPTKFPSKPQITVTGYGTLVIGNTTITIVNVYPSVVIDSELCDCYYGTTNANAQVTFSTNDFPVLESGSNAVTISGNITKVDIVPRWWRI